MNTQMIPYLPLTGLKNERKPKSIRDEIMKYGYHWPFFVASVVLFLTLAFLYIRYAAPVYEVQAKLLFKNEEKGSGRESGLQELNFAPTNKVVENEIEVLTSRTLMRQVVNDLKLWISYQQEGRISDHDLYTYSPVRLTLLNGTGYLAPDSFIVTIKDNKRFLLKRGNKETEVSFSSRLKNKYGTWKLEPAENVKEFAGSTIIIAINNPAVVAEGFLDKLQTAVVNKQATVVGMSLKETVPERGKDVLNRLITVYNQASVQDKNRVTQSTLAFIDERLAYVSDELADVERAVAGFKSSRGLTEISAQSNFFLDNFKDNDTKLNEVNVEIQVLKGIEKYAEDPGSGKIPATVGISDPGLVRLTDQLISLELQRDKLLTNTPEGHPILQTINQEIVSIRQSIKDNIRGIQSSLLAKKQKLESNNARVESSIRKLPVQERQYMDIKRQQTIKENLYTYLLRKREEAALSYASTLSDSRTVDQAYFAGKVWPKTNIICAFAFLMSLVFPAGLIFIRDMLNNKVLGREEIEDNTSVPVLGELILQNRFKQIVMNDIKCRVIAEQFRMIRTNIEDMTAAEGRCRVTQVTSGMPGEGKSFITCNLGVTFAAAGKKTIILELDMRIPSLSKYFDLRDKPGLSDYLEKGVQFEDIIQAVSGHPDLFVIGSGSIPSNPSELLEKPRLKQLLDFLRLTFDEVLIDTPPVRLLAEGRIISRYCDVNLYVVRHAYTPKAQLKYIEQLNGMKKMKNFYIILNGVAQGGAYNYSTNLDYTYYFNNNKQKRLAIGPVFKGSKQKAES